MSRSNDLDVKLQTCSAVYSQYHGYLALVVCAFGILTNVINIRILTCRKMRSPVNHLLTCLAIADLVTMISYVPFALHFSCLKQVRAEKIAARYNKAWMVFLVVHLDVTATTHVIAIWICVALAIVRYILTREPTGGVSYRFWCIKRINFLVALICIASIIELIPNYLSNIILENNIPTNLTIYVLKQLDLNDFLAKLNVWNYAVLGKLLPCVMMSIFGGLLIRRTNVKHSYLQKRLQQSMTRKRRCEQHSRTTRMLLAIISLFLITELPNGVLIICSACIEGFFSNVYVPLGDLLDIIALINNAVNFILYCAMSRKFKDTLRRHCACLPQPEKVNIFARNRFSSSRSVLRRQQVSEQSGLPPHSCNRSTSI